MSSLANVVRKCGQKVRITESDYALVAQALSTSNNLDAIDRDGENALGLAVEFGDKRLVKLVLDAGANPNRSCVLGYPLDIAAGKGQSEIVAMLLDAGAEVDGRGEDGGTALSSASAAGHATVVRQLLEAGANVRHKDRYGNRAIIYAAEKKHEEICDILAPASTPKDRQRAALIVKLKRQGPPSEAVKRFDRAAWDGDVDLVCDYLREGGDVNVMTAGGSTALFGAANRGHLGIAQRLIEHGADVNHCNENGDCALDYAAAGGHQSTYDLLYPLTAKGLRRRAEKGKAVRIHNGSWKEEIAPPRTTNPLIIAIRQHDEGGVESALRNGVSPDSRDEETDRNALGMAVRCGGDRVLELLLGAGADPNSNETNELPIITAVYQGSASAVSMLLTAGASADATDNKGVCALVHAARLGHREIVKVLLDAGAAQPPTKPSHAPIVIAAANGHKEICELLEPHSSTRSQELAALELRIHQCGVSYAIRVLMADAGLGRIRKIQDYIAAGGDVDEVDQIGQTLLSHAITSKSLELVNLLVQSGANVNHRDTLDQCPLKLAAIERTSKIYDYLYALSNEESRADGERFKQSHWKYTPSD